MTPTALYQSAPYTWLVQYAERHKARISYACLVAGNFLSLLAIFGTLFAVWVATQ